MTARTPTAVAPWGIGLTRTPASERRKPLLTECIGSLGIHRLLRPLEPPPLRDPRPGVSV
ncbi:hypothetical protein [Streptomyces sp. NPDC051014]|uniref:hypothetical protein n=1 Tax=Streptomyces sp. NPDC051014 TaxID=3155751 RepID=UPI0034040F7A